MSTYPMQPHPTTNLSMPIGLENGQLLQQHGGQNQVVYMDQIPEGYYSYEQPHHYPQHEVFKQQQRMPSVIPYFRPQTTFPSSISLMTASTNDFESRLPSEPIIMDDYQTSQMNSYPQIYGPTSSMYQQPLPLQQIPIALQPQQLLQPQQQQQQLPQQQQQRQHEQFSEQETTGLHFHLPMQQIQVKVEAKSMKINNRIIEDDEAEGEEVLQEYGDLYGQYPDRKQIKQESEFDLLQLGPSAIDKSLTETGNNASTTGTTIQVDTTTGKLKQIRKQYKPKKKYKQSRQKNVFKNFGNALINCIQNNFVIRDFIDKRLSTNSNLILAFHNEFLLNHLNNLKNKEDFLQGWGEKQPSESSEFTTFREIFRDISIMFFNEYAEKYVNESEKLKNKDIHVKAIPLFLKGIENVSELYNFKLS